MVQSYGKLRNQISGQGRHQKKATISILGTKSFDSKVRIDKLGLLPLCLYHELHVPLVLIDTVNWKYPIDWSKFVGFIDSNKSNTGTADPNLLETRTSKRKSATMKTPCDHFTADAVTAGM